MKHIAIADATTLDNENGYYAYVSDSDAGTLTVISAELLPRGEALHAAAEYMIANPGHVAGHAITQAARTLQICDANLAAANDSVYAWRCITTIEDMYFRNIPPMPDTAQPEPMGFETWQINGQW